LLNRLNVNFSELLKVLKVGCMYASISMWFAQFAGLLTFCADETETCLTTYSFQVNSGAIHAIVALGLYYDYNNLDTQYYFQIYYYALSIF